MNKQGSSVLDLVTIYLCLKIVGSRISSNVSTFPSFVSINILK